MKSLFLFSCLFFANNAIADKLICELNVSGKESKTIEASSSVSIKSGIFLCRAKKEEGEILRLRISSENNNDSANDSGYRLASETLLSIDNQGDNLLSANCSCRLE
jgi:hypothetical protein